jgi:uncharacterized protein
MALFTYSERVILVNQYKILSILEPSNAKHYASLIQILSEGFESRYSDCSMEVYPQTLSEEDCHDVSSTLQMFWDLQRDFVARNPGKDSKHLNFPGYSGNEETSQLGYVAFLIDTEKKFQGLRFGQDRFNSHSPAVDVYKRMRTAYDRIRKEAEYELNNLTNEQIQEILAERVHPSNRKPAQLASK